MSYLNQILLQPTDLLFFRDGRPMGGSLAGHTAAWPLPDVTNHALHAALHRADLKGVHEHRRGKSGDYGDQRDRKFGSLLTAGPFPVNATGQWFFPRPKDVLLGSTTSDQGSPTPVQPSQVPVRNLSTTDPNSFWVESSLPKPLTYAVANTKAPNKSAVGAPWISARAFQAYLRAEALPSGDHFLEDTQLADQEHQIGIGIDPDTQSQDGERFYSAHYLRLRDGYRLGVFAEAKDKDYQHPEHGNDLIKALLHGHPHQIVVGGQQRLCSARRAVLQGPLPIPTGLSSPGQFQQLSTGKFAVKWILLTPAIWPEMKGEELVPHPGGWLPNWICPESGNVLLKSGDTTRQHGESRIAWRERVRQLNPLSARLVAALVSKPLPVTGWALPTELEPGTGGAKSTHLAAPAGAVYYFEADSAADAALLATALNWHGPTPGTEIRNRRSTLLGEKGYGLGLCGTWNFF